MNGIGSKARERALAEQANRQFGLLRWEDLTGAGIGARAIESRLAVRRLTRVHHRVYALGHTALTAEGRWLAAVWACGPGATLSHTSAAAYHGLGPEEPGDPVHVSTTRGIRSRPGIVVHRVRRLDPVDVFVSRPFTATRIPRTLVDLADVLTWPRYRALADDQRALRLDRIREAQQRAPFRVGAPLVTRLIAADDAHTRSEFERRYLRFADAHGVPRPDALNVTVAGHQADCLYRAQHLVVELDGRAYHRRRGQMRADRRRDRDYQRARLRIARLVWDDLHPDEAAETSETLLAMLSL